MSTRCFVSILFGLTTLAMLIEPARADLTLIECRQASEGFVARDYDGQFLMGGKEGHPVQIMFPGNRSPLFKHFGVQQGDVIRLSPSGYYKVNGFDIGNYPEGRFKELTMQRMADARELPSLKKANDEIECWIGGMRKVGAYGWIVIRESKDGEKEDLYAYSVSEIRIVPENRGDPVIVKTEKSEGMALSEGATLNCGGLELKVAKIVPSDQEKRLVGWVTFQFPPPDKLRFDPLGKIVEPDE